MELELLKNIVVVFGLSAVVLFVCHRIKAPTIVGFLITGILAGPQGLGLIQATEQVTAMADIGVILLLFSIGIEMSLKDLLKIKKYVLVGGSLQVILTILAVFAILEFLWVPAGEALLMGFLISLSSTAIVLRIIQKRDEFDSIYGRTTLGILIFQDIAVVPMMLIIPLLPGSTQAATESPFSVLVKGVVFIVLVIISAKWIIPKLLFYIAKTGDRELFLLSIVALCFAVAWATSMAGLSLGLGAFLAGLIISESPYSHQAFGYVLPLRDALTSFFFVSIGMLLNLDFLMLNPAFIILLALGVMALKALIGGFATSVLGLPLRISVLIGLALSQIGEFSFILSQVAWNSGIINEEAYQLFLDIAVLTMGATSFLMAASPRIAEGVLRLPFPSRLKNGAYLQPKTYKESKTDHIIIVGYGVNGRNVAKSARSRDIPYTIVEIDPEIVKNEAISGEPIFFGDAMQESVLQHAGIMEARVLVIAISDPAATRRITELARRLSPILFIITRTRYLQEMKPLHDLGANEVIPEEYETSVEIFARVLERYQVPREEIEEFVDQVRSDSYEMFRSLSQDPYCSTSLTLPGEEVSTLTVGKGSQAEGKTAEELRLKEYGMQLLAVYRDREISVDLDIGSKLQADDVVILMGPQDNISSVKGMFGNLPES